MVFGLTLVPPPHATRCSSIVKPQGPVFDTKLPNGLGRLMVTHRTSGSRTGSYLTADGLTPPNGLPGPSKFIR